MLQSILEKYQSYDNTRGTDKNTWHSYGPLYEKLLTPYKSTAKNILEIGILSGASLYAWQEFFENAEIDGIDINLKNIRSQLYSHSTTNSRIRTYEIDGTCTDAPTLLGNKTYDVIIDDASHELEDQLKTLQIFAPYLSKTGIYIIEDIDQKYAQILHIRSKPILEQNNMRIEWYDLRSKKNRYDDIVAVFYKNDI